MLLVQQVLRASKGCVVFLGSQAIQAQPVQLGLRVQRVQIALLKDLQARLDQRA